MVAETSEASKDKQSESDTGEKNTCKCTCIFLAISAAGENNTCTCTCKIYNLISAGKATLSVKNVLLCYKSNGQCLVCVHAIRDAIG